MTYIQDLTSSESERQRTTLNLIASENYASPATLKLLGTIWNTKYAEGLPGKRYYAGNAYADELKTYVQKLALRAFGATEDYGVNVQVLSGSPANAMVYLTVLHYGDTVMSLDLASGGHLSHLHETSSWMQFYKHVTYSLNETSVGHYIDLEKFGETLAQYKPQLVIIGFSAYPPAYDFAPLIELAHEHGAMVLADIAHIAGLVAAGLHSSPFASGIAGADFVTTTTHKTLRGPRSALVFAKNEFMNRLNATIFPGTSGGPHMQQIAAVGHALLEVVGEELYPDKRPFTEYMQAVVQNAQALERGFVSTGLHPVSPTGTHLVLIHIPDDQDSLELQLKLESLGIITNRNAVPGDTKSAWRPSGMRFGTAALTSRGIESLQSEELGRLIGQIIVGTINDVDANKYVESLIKSLSWPYAAGLSAITKLKQ